ncbi:hypothetical protein JXA12_04070 [Candidatus Woesearchaeota archaeon]|nr:hypothetical protein [Candidatus Woesearchaeota archaeon]
MYQVKKMSKNYLRYKQAKAIVAAGAFIIGSTIGIQNEINYKNKHENYRNISHLLSEQKSVRKDLKKNRLFSLENVDYARTIKESLEEKADSLSNELQNYSSQEISEIKKRNKDFLMKGVYTYAFLLGYLLKGVAEINYFRKERYKELKNMRR